MPQNTNLNVSPYNDDFDDLKGYQRVLFKPDKPVQARELTTLQSILQNQIEKFGTHFFKEGSVVIPGQTAFEPMYTCVQIDTTHLGIPVSSYINELVGKQIRGERSGINAVIETYITDVESDNNHYTLYIKYKSSSTTNFVQNKFYDGENLIALEDISYSLGTIKQNRTFASTILSNSTLVGSAAKIEEGIYFIRGFFVTVPKQTVILDQYSNTPSYRIGLYVNEEIAVASDTYNDLYDNAKGFSNYTAPGADRLKLTATLIKKNIDDFNDENFVEIMRVNNGRLEKFEKNTEYNLLSNELARRTYDESGDYYVKPFTVTVKESLNDRIGSDGLFYENGKTSQGNIPSESLGCYSISPGKAYVKGYEIETIDNVIFDFKKPRTTKKVFNASIPFNIGKLVSLNNVYGSSFVGFGTNSIVNLYNDRTVNPGQSSGTKIGFARIYDLKLKNSEYTNASSIFECSLYDIQTFTEIVLNTTVNVSTPALIKGKNSGSYGYLSSSVTNSSILELYETSGSFIEDEKIIINGIEKNITLISSRDYSLSDVNQLHIPSSSGIGTFTADTILSNKFSIADSGTNFTISTASDNTSSGISTVIAGTKNFYIGLNPGDIVSYTKSGENVPTYNKVVSINTSSKSIIISPTTSVAGVCSGSLPTSKLDVVDFKKVTLEISKTSQSYLYSKLNNTNIESLDLENSDYIFRKSYTVQIGSVTPNSYTSILETDDTLTLEQFDEEDYSLTYNNTGVIEPLNDQKVTISGRSITLSNLNVSSGEATLTVTFKKINPKTRKKVYNRCSSIVVNKSSSVGSGIGSTTFDDGLTYSQIYGLRVQDEEISLNVPDVESVIAIYESTNNNDPSLPSLTISDLNSNILNSIKGEKIIGEKSGAVGSLISNNGSNTIEFVYLNENKFILNENIIFDESKIKATIDSIEIGDINILDSFDFDSGQRSEYLDFSRIIRKKTKSAPKRKIKIVFNNYTINSNDIGDFVSVSSFDKDRYSFDIPSINGNRVSDIIDLRPRVSPYSGSVSPFEFSSRDFSSSVNSSKYVFSRNKSINLSYNYYLPRIDKIFLTKEGKFVLNMGIPSDDPQSPLALDSAIEIASITIPPYLYDANDATVIHSTHKRYTMKDISSLDTRLSNVEYYTSLSLLESDTKNLVIRDPQTNLDRFKCGFFVDNFKSINSGDITNINFKSSIDSTNGTLRPQSYTNSVDLLLGSESVIGISTTSNPNVDLRFINDLGSPNIKKVGNILCLNYTDIEYSKNNFATRTENINPFNVINWIGTIELSPSTDTWVETNKTTRINSIEGNYNSTVNQLNINTNTGLSPIEWNSWEIHWTGTKTVDGPPVKRILDKTTLTSSTTSSGSRTRGRRLVTITNNYKDQYTEFYNEVKSGTQTREGIQYKVSSREDTVNVGDRLISRELIKTMRSRNIELVARRLKPNTKLYLFFDGIDMSSYFVPKLLEITMIGGKFEVGETVTGILGNKSISLRVASSNHKYGPYNNPNQIYTTNPYDNTKIIPSDYSSTSTILNVDTASLDIMALPSYFGSVSIDMVLKGSNSGATAKINNLRLVSDEVGSLIGSVFIPPSNVPGNPSFETGTKVLKLTTSPTNSLSQGTSDSSLAESNFVSSGFIDNLETSILSIRNAVISREIIPESKNITDTETTLQARTTFVDRTTTSTHWVDPLAQSFEVQDTNGIFATKCDIFFKTKDVNNIPVTFQLRTMQNGIPTQTIIPFSEVIKDSSEINVSEDGSVPTTFIFSSPVYLESGKSYAIVLLSSSNAYNVWISRMGETDVSTLKLPDSQKKIVSQQPTLGSLFKSQNGSTWDASQLDDLKYTLYRANFVTAPASVRFYNPDFGIGNNHVASLQPNAITCYSKTVLVGLANTIKNTDINKLNTGNTITQDNNSKFTGNLVSVLGSIGISSSLAITNPGYGFTSGITTYTNIPLQTLTGFGIGARADITVGSNQITSAVVTDGGYGYNVGDVLGVLPSNTGGFGKDVRLSIPNNTGIISAFNSIIVDDVQGSLNINQGDIIQSNSVGITSCYVNSIINLTDGLHFKVSHNDHGMYAKNNIVEISGIESDISPTKLTSQYSSTSTNQINIISSDNFATFENVGVSSLNPGYVLINDEIIQYTGITGNTLTGIARGVDGSFVGTHDINDLVFKYEYNGVSLRRINKSHSFTNTSFESYPIELDSYHLKIDNSQNGINRSQSSSFPELYFKSNKTGGSYLYTTTQKNSLNGLKASQNIHYNLIHPNISTMLPEKTSISASIRTISGTSVDGDEISFIDNGFEPVTIGSNNELSSMRIICSKQNEISKLEELPGNKSFTMEFVLSTLDSKVSPLIDLERVNIITSANRINRPIIDFTKDSRSNELSEDPNASVYISQKVILEKSADSLKVLFDAYRHESNDIILLYRLFRNDSPENQQIFELFPGYDNLTPDGNIINPKYNSGKSDKFIQSSNRLTDFSSYEYTAKNLALFNGFQIKIIMTGTDQSKVPNIKDLRVIATI